METLKREAAGMGLDSAERMFESLMLEVEQIQQITDFRTHSLHCENGKLQPS